MGREWKRDGGGKIVWAKKEGIRLGERVEDRLDIAGDVGIDAQLFCTDLCIGENTD